MKTIKYFLIFTIFIATSLLHSMNDNSEISEKLFNTSLSVNGVRKLLIDGANPNYESKKALYLRDESFYSNGLKRTIKVDSLCTPLHFFANKKYGGFEDDYKNIKTLIIGGADIEIQVDEWLTAADVAKYTKSPGLSDYIYEKAKQRDELFKAVMENQEINFQKISGISRLHVSDIKGNSLLYYALKHANNEVARKLIILWPKLLKQPNFEGKIIFEELPVECWLHLLTPVYEI